MKLSKFMMTIVPVMPMLAFGSPLVPKVSNTGGQMGSSFNEVLSVAKDNAVEPLTSSKTEQEERLAYNLTQYNLVTNKMNVVALFRFLSDRAKQTLNDKTDYYERFTKLVHSNGVCVSGQWSIDEGGESSEKMYTGYFKKGSKALFIGRISTALGDVDKDHERGFGFAGKLFPTEDSNVVVPTTNFFTVDNLSGTKALRFLEVGLTNNPPLTPSFKIALPLIAIIKAFSPNDSNPTFRPITQIARINEFGPIRSPRFMRLKVKDGQIINNESDFRNEVMKALNVNNGVLQFDVDVTNNDNYVNEPSVWKKIGSIKLNEAFVSYGCDHRLHFGHPKDDGSKSADVSINYRERLALVQNSNWKGKFKVMAAGNLLSGDVTEKNTKFECEGDMMVHFFPLEKTEFSNGELTMSYRHHASFSDAEQAKKPLCVALVKKLSPVDYQGCNAFPTRYSDEEQRQVPYRTVVIKDAGAGAYVSSPSCSKGKVVRDQMSVVKADVSSSNPDHFNFEINMKVLNQKIRLIYELDRVR